MGFCIRDSVGILLSEGVLNCGNIFILVIEVIGFKEGVRELKNLGFY